MNTFRTAAKALVGAGGLVLAALVAPAGAASGAATGAPADSHVVRHAGAITAAEQQRVRDYWTPERMRAAIPRDVALKVTPTAKPGSKPTTWKAVRVPAQSQLGKVYFTMGSTAYVCSGTATESANKDVVTTAGHCVYDPDTGLWATNFTFWPGYEDGVSDTYGTWVAKNVLTTNQWIGARDFDYDVGMAVMNEQDSESLTDRTGSYPIAFDLDYGLKYDAYGYPAARPFNGEYLYKCTGTSGTDLLGDTTDHSLACNMTGGSSGGGWITTDGKLNSVNSFKYTSDSKTMYGPYFGSVIEDLYHAAASTS